MSPTHATYEILINVSDDKFLRDDPHHNAEYVFVYRGWARSDNTDHLLDDIYSIHNRDDRPDGRLGPSLSIGDVVALELGGEFGFANYGCTRTGWVLMDDLFHVERSKTYLQIIKEKK